MSFGLAILLSCLLPAVFFDVRARRIPNILIFFGLIGAIFVQVLDLADNRTLAISFEVADFLFVLTGISVGFGSLFPFYALRAMGAGDVKLMMMVGAFLGPLQTLGVVVLTFLAGGILAMGMALWQRSLPQLFMNLRYMLTTSAVRAAGGENPRFEPLVQTAGRMPYAVAIAVGTVLQLILVRSGGWALS